MKKRIWITLLTLIALICFTFGISACAEQGSTGNGPQQEQGSTGNGSQQEQEDTPPVVEVTGITLNKSALDLYVDDTAHLTATISPSNATDKSVSWTSSDNSVATVSGGTVRGIKSGMAVIVATAGGKSATCTVNVSEKTPLEEDDSNFEFTRYSNGYAVTGYMGLEKNIVVPSTHDGFPVVAIGTASVYGLPMNGFTNNYNVTSIVLPNSINEINIGAFSNCFALKSINIPTACVCIRQYAFQNSGIEEIVIPNEIRVVYPEMFRGCNSLRKLTFPYLFEEEGGIGKLFFGVSSNADMPSALKEIVFTRGLKVSGTLLRDCRYIEKIVLPDGVTSIENYAFYGCSSLGSINIPDSVTTIGSSAFYKCTSLESVTIGNSVTYIDSAAFYYCTSLTSITIPDGVTSIKNSAFAYCTSLTSITIPDSVTTIDEYAFAYCTSLTSITIPDSVTSIGSYAFRNCGNLTSATFKNPYGWQYLDSMSTWREISQATLSNPATAAQYLREYKQWRRS